MGRLLKGQKLSWKFQPSHRTQTHPHQYIQQYTHPHQVALHHNQDQNRLGWHSKTTGQPQRLTLSLHLPLNILQIKCFGFHLTLRRGFTILAIPPDWNDFYPKCLHDTLIFSVRLSLTAQCKIHHLTYTSFLFILFLHSIFHHLAYYTSNLFAYHHPFPNQNIHECKDLSQFYVLLNTQDLEQCPAHGRGLILINPELTFSH